MTPSYCMTSLPPRPDSPPRRYTADDRDRRLFRPTPPESRYYPDRSDRGHPRARHSDSYVPSSYDSRREPDTRRREYDDRDRDRDRRSWDRSREFRDADRGPRYSPDQDRYRRGPGRERSPERGSSRYPSRERHREPFKHSSRRDFRSPSPRRDGYRRSRSPPPRRRNDSSPFRGQKLPHPRSRSPPQPRIMRLGSHSIDIGPHVPERCSPSHPSDSVKLTHVRSRSPPQRTHSKSPVCNKRGQTPPIMAEVQDSAQTHPQTVHKEVTEVLERPPAPQASRPQPEPTSPMANSTAVGLPPREPLADRLMEAMRESEHQDVQKTNSDIKIPDRSPTSPKPSQAKQRQTAPQHPRSPPRGPRNHKKGNIPPTGPAYLHPPGPQGQRRPYLAVAAPATPALSIPSSQAAFTEPQVVPTQSVLDAPKVSLPIIPPWEGRPSLTRELDAEITRLQAHRAHLVTEYGTISKLTRRALHELDMAAIDLRAAETRRRIADSQMEKARAGVLGIDAVLIDSLII